MWILHLLNHRDIIQLDVQILIHALQCSSDRNVVLELDGDFVVDKSLEEAEEQHDDEIGVGGRQRGGGGIVCDRKVNVTEV